MLSRPYLRVYENNRRIRSWAAKRWAHPCGTGPGGTPKHPRGLPANGRTRTQHYAALRAGLSRHAPAALRFRSERGSIKTWDFSTAEPWTAACGAPGLNWYFLSPEGGGHDSPGWSEAESLVGDVEGLEPASAGGRWSPRGTPAKIARVPSIPLRSMLGCHGTRLRRSVFGPGRESLTRWGYVASCGRTVRATGGRPKGTAHLSSAY